MPDLLLVAWNNLKENVWLSTLDVCFAVAEGTDRVGNLNTLESFRRAAEMNLLELLANTNGEKKFAVEEAHGLPVAVLASSCCFANEHEGRDQNGRCK